MPAPPKVDNIETYWTEEPPDLSPRCRYWIRRIERGWRGNKRFRGKGYSEKAEHLGVYIWEWLHVLSPLFEHKMRTDPCPAGPASSVTSSQPTDDIVDLSSIAPETGSGSRS